MGEREHITPLASYSSPSLHIDEDRAISGQLKLRRRRSIQCCGCITAILLILIVIILVLSFTVFNLKEPKLMMNGVALNGTLPRNNSSIELVADVSVKNPNSYSFRFRNTTTTIYYEDTAIGEGRTPAGKAKARRTLRLNVTVEIVSNTISGIPSFWRDINDGVVNISSYTKIDGKVKILNLFNKRVVVKMNCTVDYNLIAGSSQGNNCHTRVEI